MYDGVPLAGVSIRVEGGEVQIAGPVLASGYLDDDERTAKAFVTDADGTRWWVLSAEAAQTFRYAGQELTGQLALLKQAASENLALTNEILDQTVLAADSAERVYALVRRWMCKKNSRWSISLEDEF